MTCQKISIKISKNNGFLKTTKNSHPNLIKLKKTSLLPL